MHPSALRCANEFRVGDRRVQCEAGVTYLAPFSQPASHLRTCLHELHTSRERAAREMEAKSQRDFLTAMLENQNKLIMALLEKK